MQCKTVLLWGEEEKNCSEMAWLAVPAGPRSPRHVGVEPLAFFSPAAAKNLCYAESVSQWCEGIPGSHTPGPVNTALFLQKPFHGDRHLETVKETLLMKEPSGI